MSAAKSEKVMVVVVVGGGGGLIFRAVWGGGETQKKSSGTRGRVGRRSNKFHNQKKPKERRWLTKGGGGVEGWGAKSRMHRDVCTLEREGGGGSKVQLMLRTGVGGGRGACVRVGVSPLHQSR